MRAKAVYLLVAAACLALAAGYRFRSDISAETGRLFAEGAGKPSDAAEGRAPRGVAVVSATASTADFPIIRHAIGFIASPAVVNVNARISSQIVSIAVKDGQMVKAGDLLFSLDDRALRAQVAHDQATLAKDQATLVSNTADLDRAKDLAAEQAGTQQAYDQALAVQKAQAATVDADKAQLDADTIQLGFAGITAPITGRLGVVNVSVGDLVGPPGGGSTASTPLVTITQMDPLEVDFALPESDLDLLHAALAKPRPGAVTLMRQGDAKPVGTGTLDFLDSSVDTQSGTIAARASVPNPDLALWPGQYVDVALNAGTMPQMTSIPTVAVQPSQKGPFVYVVKPDDTVEMRPVTVALSQGEASGISQGLKSGEKVVVEGQTRLKDGAAVRDGEAAAAPAGSGAARGTRP